MNTHLEELLHLVKFHRVGIIVAFEQRLLLPNPLVQITIRLFRWPLLVFLKVKLQHHVLVHPLSNVLNT